MSAAHGGPAFPTGEEHGFNNGEPGMTLRDYFAAQSLGNVAHAICDFRAEDQAHAAGAYAVAAYLLADAMLAERAK